VDEEACVVGVVVFGAFALGMQVVHQVLDFIGPKNITEGGHRSAAVVNLMLNLLFVSAFSDDTQIWSEISSAAVHTMAMLTPFFVKEHRTRFLIST
jgi:hypothetical protein